LVIGGVAAGWGHALATDEPAANVGGDGYLIRNASLVLTMDPHLGERGILGQLKNADVLIVGDRIAAVGVNLSAPSGVHVIDGRGRIVMPGFVETHNHLWQSLVRGCEHDESFPGWATGCILLCSATTSSASLWTGTLAARIIIRDHNLVAEEHLGHEAIYGLAPPCVASH